MAYLTKNRQAQEEYANFYVNYNTKEKKFLLLLFFFCLLDRASS